MLVNTGQTAIKPKNLAQDGKTSTVFLNKGELRRRFVSVLKRPIAMAVIAFCGAGTINLLASTATLADCIGNLNGPNGVDSWGPSASNGAASVATSLTTAITTLDIAFLTQTSAFVGTPNNPQPNQLGGGVWIRGVGGQNTVTSTGTATPGLNTANTVPTGSGSCTVNSQGRMGFGGFQAGMDLGRFNTGASGLNVIVGVTGGVLDATDQQLNSPGGTFTFTVPFVGGYAAATWGNFFADMLVREDFYQIDVTAGDVGLSNAGLKGNAINVMGEAGYRYDFGHYFVEPSVGLIWSHLNLGTLSTPAIPLTLPVGGVFTFNPIDSLIGRAGVRVGTSLTAGNVGLQPFVAASIWSEFAGDTTSSFVCNCQNAPVIPPLLPTGVNVSSTRVGTFGQFGLGTAAQILNTGWLGFVRADYRTGENIQGWDLTGGIRYQFALGVPPAPLVTKN